MNNPWKTVDINDYEEHMKLDSVQQLQTLNEIMNDQFYRYPTSAIMILGIAGGNGLNHIEPGKIDKVFGVDINAAYLQECVNRYLTLKDIFFPIQADLQNQSINLPKADIIVANLLIEYIGYENFQKVIEKVKPQYVSCVIQVNTGAEFVSDSPYIHAFDCLEEVHHQIKEQELTDVMKKIEYQFIFKDIKRLPNKKELVRLDYRKL